MGWSAYQVVDNVTQILATQYNKVLESTIRGLFSNTETLAANKTLVDDDFALQWLTLGAARDVTLPAVSTANHQFYIYNATGASFSITVKNAGGTTIATLPPLVGGYFFSNGVSWISSLNNTTVGGLALLALTGVANRVPYYTAAGTVSTAKLWIPVVKTSDENVASSTTFISDAAIRLALAANTKYAIRGRIYFTTGATPDFKYRFTSPASPTTITWVYSHIIPGTTARVTNVETVVTTTSTPVVGAGTTGGYVEFDMMVQNVNSGLMAFQWAQNTSDPVNATVLAGSYMEYMIID